MTLQDTIKWLEGKKTYFLCILAVIYALSGYFTGHFDMQTALDMVWVALTGSAMRSAIKP